MTGQRIIMNYTTPPDLDDLAAIANSCLQLMPEELTAFCDNLAIEIEDLPDDVILDDANVDEPYDLVAFLKRGNQLSPGVEKKSANDEDVLTIYRRPLLDYWCETQDDLKQLMRQIIIEELGQNYDFSDDEIDEMAARPYQGAV